MYAKFFGFKSLAPTNKDVACNVSNTGFCEYASFFHGLPNTYRVITKKRPSLYLSYLKSDFNERYIKLKGSKSTINWI
jgi:hypothetical protein